MAQTVVLKGAECKLFISGKVYPEVQSITFTIDYGETEIYGIDSQYPQEIAPTRVSVQGQVNGIRVKLSGGLQGKNARSKINEILHAPYTSLRIKDRQSDLDLLWLPQMKIVNESMTIQARGVVKMNFTFKGIIPYLPIDLNG